jgi:hypothetical protein
MASTSELLAAAIQHHQASRLQVAEQIYRQILQSNPNHVDALHPLGLIGHQVVATMLPSNTSAVLFN